MTRVGKTTPGKKNSVETAARAVLTILHLIALQVVRVDSCPKAVEAIDKSPIRVG